jgi:carboxylate-amine ligase
MPRYRQMQKESGYLAQTQITFSTHVHVGMESGDQAILVMSRLIPAIPALIALSANSPFWRGHETGHAAYRHRILAAAPNYGLPTRFEDWRSFDKFLDAAQRAGMIGHFKDIHWDIRPHPDFGTLEIRAMDAASNLRAVHGLVAFVRCVAIRLATAEPSEIGDVLPVELPSWIENQNRFRAGLSGLEAEYIVDSEGNHRPIRDLIADLLAFCEPVAEKCGEQEGLAIARELIIGKPGYECQTDVYRHAKSARSVVEMLQDSLLEELKR